MILLPYPLIRFTHLPIYPLIRFRRCILIKIIVSALILCKNNAMNIFH
ncbi:hypothetical protein HMPREF1427_01013 [Helicobacter pylori GAM83Bi]|nr:hypothetical protein HMPREF1427_01013 [Helicobacter pylori GAM83Bi]EMH37752.1 hypothetical protein HMPREF1428_01443 [Helicobacter pylori GAM83T]